VYEFTDEQMESAIVGSAGIVSTIAKRLAKFANVKRISWSTAEKYANSKPEYIQLLKDETETVLDMADGKLYEQIKNGEAWAIKWLQATKGKKRGYVERTESAVTHKFGIDADDEEYVD